MATGITLGIVKRIFGEKKKDEGPFKANRILNTSEAKIDQIFTKEEKAVALFIHTTEDEAKKIGARGAIGPTKFSGEWKYEREKKWVTRAIYFPINIPGAKFDKHTSEQITASVVTSGTLVPENIKFEEVKGEQSFPVSGSSILRTNENGYAEISGSFVASGPASTRSLRIYENCPYCCADIEIGSNFCPKCGKSLKQ